jgi:hypothetical protein
MMLSQMSLLLLGKRSWFWQLAFWFPRLVCWGRFLKDSDQIPSSILRVIQCNIGSLYDFSARPAVVRESCNTETCSDRNIDDPDRLQLPSGPFSHGRRLSCIMVVEHERDLFSAVPICPPLAFSNRRNASSDSGKYCVSYLVPVNVVHRFEVIDIGHDYAQRPTAVCRFSEALGKLSIECSSAPEFG